MSLFVWLSLSVLVTSFICPAIAKKDAYATQELITAYEKLINFVEKYKQKMNIDGVFALVLGEAQLDMILRLPLNRDVLIPIKRLKLKTNKIIEKLKSTVYVPPGSLQTIFKILDANLWTTNRVFHYNRLTQMETPIWSLKHMYEGQPTETQSDVCIAEAIAAGPFNILHDCDFKTDFCSNIYLDAETSRGYPLTHRLLYWQVTDVFGCRPFKDKKMLKEKFCSRILADAKSIEYANYPSSARDLFIEQMLLCGMEGYTEFLTTKWRQALLSWQTSEGCYTPLPPDGIFTKVHNNDKNHLRILNRNKRASFVMAHGCENHITGLAAAAMMLHLRHLLRPSISEWGCGDTNDFYGN